MTSTTPEKAEQGLVTVGTAEGAEAAPPRRPRTRRYRKRTRFQHVPHMAYPVKALWDAAAQEERELAHRQCTTLLELWLGKATKEEAMERLQIPALRLWQMSQQALSGMVAGLLRQPKRRVPKGETLMPNPDSDVKVLRKKNAELEKENEGLKAILTLLRDLPGNRERVGAAASQARRRRGAAVPEKPEATAVPTPIEASAPPEPAAAVTKTPPKVPRGRPKADRAGAPVGTDPLQ